MKVRIYPSEPTEGFGFVEHQHVRGVKFISVQDRSLTSEVTERILWINPARISAVLFDPEKE